MNATELSKSLWAGANAAYLLRDGAQMRSTTKDSYGYDHEELAFMKAQGDFEKKHVRKRDEFTAYLEAAARDKNTQRAAKGQ
jgi:hypothetical protein